MAKLFTVGADRKLVDRTPDGRGMSMPVGSFMWFAGTTPPESWMLCDGSAISRSTFAALFAVIGETFGRGDGSTTFNLPDLRGRFLQGATIAGDVREAGLPNITGEVMPMSNLNTAFSCRTGGAFYSDESSFTVATIEPLYMASSYGAKFDASKSNSIYGASSTVQPPAVTAIPCIKAFGSVVNDLSVPLSDLVVRSTIIYPNGGRAGAEANVTTNQRIVMDNPFAGYFVQCEAQVKLDGKWGDAGWYTEWVNDAYFSGARSIGIKTTQLIPDDKLIVVSGTLGTHTDSRYMGTPFGDAGSVTVGNSVCRVIVHRMGKM